MRTKNGRQRSIRLKPLLYTLLALVLILAATLAPRFLLRFEQRQIMDSFRPVAQQGGTLSYDDNYYYAGAIIRQRSARELESWSDYLEPEAAWEILDKQVAMLGEAGLLPAGFLLPGIEIEEVFGGGINYRYRKLEMGNGYEIADLEASTWLTSRFNDTYETSIYSAWYDENNLKPIYFSYSLPGQWDLIRDLYDNSETDLVQRMQAYIRWLELDHVDDWVIEDVYQYQYEVSYSAYATAYSDTANITLEIQLGYDNYDRRSILRYYANVMR